MTVKAPEFNIGSRAVGPAHDAYVIAEVGINHGGDESVCMEMISAVAKTGADAVKLQTVVAEESYHPDTESYAVFKDSALTREAMERLIAHAAREDVALFSTPGDMVSLLMLAEIGMPAIKISSGLLTNLPLIRKSASLGVPLILSTGMAHLAEVKEAVDVARAAGATEIAVLQCTSLYPAPSNTLNLRAIEAMAHELGVVAGYSDHHDGILACVAAVAARASIIEKHFSTNPKAAGADHAISADPEDFTRMVQDIRDVETMLGRSEKAPTEKELPLRDSRHRRLVAARDISPEEIFSDADLYLMRLPADRPALPASRLDDVVGRKAACGIPRLTGVSEDMVRGLD